MQAPHPGSLHQQRLSRPVIWSWQQAVLAAGLERQLRRHDLPPSLKALLKQVQEQLWGPSLGARDAQFELWSWAYEAGHFRLRPSVPVPPMSTNPRAQLWSTVFLAIPDPLATR